VTAETQPPRVAAVIFDWGGTLTAWHDIDFHEESLALAQAVTNADHDVHVSAARLHEAGTTVWGWCRDQQRSATIADLFEVAGLDHDPELLTAYHDFWEPHTLTDPDVAPLWRGLRERGIRVGVLSNTIWPRAWHEEFFRRDGVLDLLDGDVYTCELDCTKPAAEAFRAAAAAVGASGAARCVYVGDRLYDDIRGARNAGMRSIHVPHSRIPESQRGHTDGVPDAVVQRLADVAEVIDRWT
jgi:putative hydrolase of the HAD superfamily